MEITATYSPEDNKIRIYASERFDAETYARIKEAGFQWAPKQKLFVAPKWTPLREDLAIELAGDIEAEEMTLAERAEMKAERLDALAKKRYEQAVSLHNRADEISQSFYMGQPILIGHHSERKARKAQERMQSTTQQAAKAESAANYWLYRATGVERFVNMKNCDRTRSNRIKTLLAELRDLQRDINTAHNALALWERFTTPERIEWALGYTDSRALMAGHGLWSSVRDGKMSADDARARCIENANRVINGPNRKRCIDHVLNRLSFERSMLGDVPRYSGEITPVILQAFAREHGAEKPKATETDPGFFQIESAVPLPLHIGHGRDYLELSCDEWRDVMQACGYSVPDAKPRRVSSKPAPMPLINLSQEQAEQLQRIWNQRAEKSENAHGKADGRVRNVTAMTQSLYSDRSKGTYSPCETVEIDETGARVRGFWRNREWVLSGEPVARIRIYTAGGWLYGPNSVIFITDKPTKPLPFDLDAIERDLLGGES